MSEQRGFDATSSNPETARGITNASMVGWTQITQHLVDHTLEALSHQLAFGRVMVESRSIGELLDAQAALGQRNLETAQKCGRQLAETSQTIARELTGRVFDAVNGATAYAEQQARSTEDQLRRTSDQAREAATGVAREINEVAARASTAKDGAATPEAPRPESMKPNGQTAQAIKQGAPRQ